MSAGFRLDRYLKRVGAGEPIAPNLATLTTLHAAHVQAIPFEGLDPFLRRSVKLDLASLQEKMLDGRRGGYCFEQNTLFKAALESIGFKVTGLAGRVRWTSPPDSPLGPRTHMFLKVDLPNGPVIADVGFGVCVIDAPLEFKIGVEQRTAMGIYRLSEADGLFWLSAKRPDGWRAMYAFNLEPQTASDYEVGNWYTSTNPGSLFAKFLVVERVDRDRRYKIINTRFLTEARDGEPVGERALGDAEQLGAVLEGVFKISPPAPIGDLFSRIVGEGGL